MDASHGQQGFESIFNGKDLDGWTMNDGKTPASEVVKAEDGAMKWLDKKGGTPYWNTELGDFQADGVRLLADPTTEELRAALDLAAARFPPGDEGLFLFFYSGHSDDKHLHLRGQPLQLDELYRRVRDLPATVKVGVLDACQSGSILTAKGGRPTSVFRVSVQDELSVHGVAFLTSSGADELSQEARAIQGSFFSHHLVSGLRGAAQNVTVSGETWPLGGDVIVKADGRTVASVDRLRAIVSAKKPGDNVKLDIYRDSKQTTLNVKLGRQPSSPRC